MGLLPDAPQKWSPRDPGWPVVDTLVQDDVFQTLPLSEI